MDAEDPRDLNTTDIASYSLKLSVDPRYITSWGFFRDAAFTAQVPVMAKKNPNPSVMRSAWDGLLASGAVSLT